MILHISMDELPDFFNSYRIKYACNLCIDYETNTLNCLFEGEEYTLFKFDDFMRLDNRFCSYEISWGAAGIFIHLIK